MNCTWIEAARRVVRECQARKVNIRTGIPRESLPEDYPAGHPAEKQRGRAVTLDLFTASMLVQVYDALSEANREKFGSLDLLRAVQVGWAATKKAAS